MSLLGLFVSYFLVRKEKGRLKQMQKSAVDIIQYVQTQVSAILQLTPEDEQEEQATPVLQREEVRVTPDDHVMVQQLLRKAEKVLDDEDYEEVEKILIEALAYNAEDEDVNTMLAYVYRKQGKYSKAENIYIHLIEEGNQDAAIFSNLGKVLEEQDRLEMAVKSYQEALKRDPHSDARYATLAQALLKQGKVRESIDMLEQALRFDSRNTEYMFGLAEAYMRVDAVMQATKYLDMILNNEPYNEKAKSMLIAIKEQGKIEL